MRPSLRNASSTLLAMLLAELSTEVGPFVLCATVLKHSNLFELTSINLWKCLIDFCYNLNCLGSLSENSWALSAVFRLSLPGHIWALFQHTHSDTRSLSLSFSPAANSLQTVSSCSHQLFCEQSSHCLFLSTSTLRTGESIRECKAPPVFGLSLLSVSGGGNATSMRGECTGMSNSRRGLTACHLLGPQMYSHMTIATLLESLFPVKRDERCIFSRLSLLASTLRTGKCVLCVNVLMHSV